MSNGLGILVVVVVVGMLFGSIGYLAGADITKREAMKNNAAHYICNEKSAICDFAWGVK